MQNLKLRVLYLLVCLAVPALTHSQKAPGQTTGQDVLPSAKELADKCARASGGKEGWAKITSMVLRGTLEMEAPPLKGTVEIHAKAPNKVLNVFSLADGQFVHKEGFDGQTGWQMDSQNGLKKLEGAELEKTKLDAIFDSEVRLKELYPDLQVVGRTNVNGRDAYAALTHRFKDRAVTWYFDAETGLRIAEDSEGADASGKVEKSTTFYEDYRRVGGVLVPFRIRLASSSMKLVVSVLEAQPNVVIDDAIFAMPSSSVSSSGAASANQADMPDEGAEGNL